jgi:hypothetical protein
MAPLKISSKDQGRQAVVARTATTDVACADETERDDDVRFSLSLSFRHPDIDPDEITRVLGRAPYQSWRAGAPRRTPAGHEMPSVGRQSYWVWTTEVSGRRNFFAALMEEVDGLAAHAVFLAHVVGSGGRVALVINLPGDSNIGAILTHQAVQRIAGLPIDIGVEVFPDMP